MTVVQKMAAMSQAPPQLCFLSVLFCHFFWILLSYVHCPNKPYCTIWSTHITYQVIGPQHFFTTTNEQWWISMVGIICCCTKKMEVWKENKAWKVSLKKCEKQPPLWVFLWQCPWLFNGTLRTAMLWRLGSTLRSRTRPLLLSPKGVYISHPHSGVHSTTWTSTKPGTSCMDFSTGQRLHGQMLLLLCCPAEISPTHQPW